MTVLKTRLSDSQMSIKSKAPNGLAQNSRPERFTSMIYRLLIVLGFFMLSLPLVAQQDSLQVDSLTEQDNGFFYRLLKEDYPNPKRAALFSLIIPGTGQIYNKRWWKAPIIYGALGGMIYLIDYNSQNYNRVRVALDLKRQDLPHEFSGTSIDSESALLRIRNNFDKNLQLSYIGLIFVYMLNGIEAYVDAHLMNFDVDEDISMRIKPQFEMNTQLGSPIIGIGLQFQPSQTKVIEYKDFLGK